MEAIMRHLADQESPSVEVACVISDHATAYVLERAEQWELPSYHLTKAQLSDKEILLPLLHRHEVDAIILAGYLQLIPPFLLEAFPHKILNIHPALLPKFGGKGMYGMHVHRAVKQAGEQESGITIHIIDKEYDRGETIFQATTPLSPSDTPEEIAHKVQKLEHQHFPRVIVEWLENTPHE